MVQHGLVSRKDREDAKNDRSVMLFLLGKTYGVLRP